MVLCGLCRSTVDRGALWFSGSWRRRWAVGSQGTDNLAEFVVMGKRQVVFVQDVHFKIQVVS